MKNFKTIFAVSTLLCSSFTAPITPRTAKTAIAAVSMASGMNIGMSYQKRTAAIQKEIKERGFREEELKTNRVWCTGAAVLLGVGASAAVSVAAFKRVPPHLKIRL